MWPTEQNRQAWDQRYGHPRSGARLPDAVRERLPEVSGKHVLHLACGTGEVSGDLISLGALVTGVDPSEQALAVAREHVPAAAFFQADVQELPLLLKRSRFNVVYAGEGALALVRDLDLYLGGIVGALRKGGRVLLHDWHPVALCVEPVGLRWRDSYFSESLWRLGQVVGAVSRAGLKIEELAELPPAATEFGGRLDPRMPTDFLLDAVKTEATTARRAPRA